MECYRPPPKGGGMVTTLATHWRTDQGLIIVYGLDDLSRLDPSTALLTPPPFTPLRRYIICDMFIQDVNRYKSRSCINIIFIHL